MKLFACPYELPMCGPSPKVTLPVNGVDEALQSRGGFITDEVCYYWIEAAANVPIGNLVYVRFTVLNNVETFVTIKEDFSDKDIICNVFSGDMILVRHPNKLYMSFKATSSSDSKFFVQTFYAKTATADSYVNQARCSDRGASLGDMLANIETDNTGG